MGITSVKVVLLLTRTSVLLKSFLGGPTLNIKESVTAKFLVITMGSTQSILASRRPQGLD